MGGMADKTRQRRRSFAVAGGALGGPGSERPATGVHHSGSARSLATASARPSRALVLTTMPFLFTSHMAGMDWMP